MRDEGGPGKWRDRIAVKKHLGQGCAYVKGTRVPVHTILEKIADGQERQEILAAFSGLTQEDVAAAAAYAAEVLRAQGSYEHQRVLGAFLTDIKDSTARMEKHGRQALDFHRLYLESVFHYYRSCLPEPLWRHYRVENFWFPGDALWGVFLKHEELDEEVSIARWMWHYLFSIACGLGLADDYRRSRAEEGLQELQIRGVLLAGKVNDPRFDDEIKIYGGTALNACGRLEKEALSNSVLLGYVFHRSADADEKKMFKDAAGSPRLGIDELKSYIYDVVCQNPDSKIPGCRIEVETVQDGDSQLLRFRGLSKALRGLEGCQLLAAKVRLVPTKGSGIEVVPTSDGALWQRRRVVLKLREDSCDLHEVLRESSDPAFDFMTNVYARDHLRFQSLRGGAPVLECKKSTFRPLLEDGAVTKAVDFKVHKSCVLPTNKHRSSGRAGVLVQSLGSDANTILRFSKVDVKRDLGSRWEDFLDSGCPALEVVLKPVQPQSQITGSQDTYGGDSKEER